ncbi:MAG: hypothetical protein WC647_00125 [Desulfomonilaceae bacterium]|jgi:Na+-translocating ferredoxin:NAD+ oxidoreductase RNF subunit RnfB
MGKAYVAIAWLHSQRLFREAVSYHIDPTMRPAFSVCLKKCPKEAIVGGKNLIQVIDQEKCTK